MKNKGKKWFKMRPKTRPKAPTTNTSRKPPAMDIAKTLTKTKIINGKQYCCGSSIFCVCVYIQKTTRGYIYNGMYYCIYRCSYTSSQKKKKKKEGIFTQGKQTGFYVFFFSFLTVRRDINFIRGFMGNTEIQNLTCYSIYRIYPITRDAEERESDEWGL